MKGSDPPIPLVLGDVPLERMPYRLRQGAVMGFAARYEDGDEMSQAVRDSFLRYLKQYRRRLWNEPRLLAIMLKEKCIRAQDFPEVLKTAGNDPERTALLLDYRNRTISQEEMDRAERQKMDRELKAMMRERPLASELRKIWATRKEEDGTLLLWKLKQCPEDLVVPDMIGKTRVTAVYGMSCRQVKGVKHVTVLPGVTLRNYSFSSCPDLTRVTLPLHPQMGDACFVGCPRLQSFDLDPEETGFRAEGPVLWELGEQVILRAAGGVRGTYAVPEGTQVIGVSAFESNDALTGVILPSSLKTISRHAFYQCPGLTEVTIPPSVEKVHLSAFWSCSSLNTITVLGSDTALLDCDQGLDFGVTLRVPGDSRSLPQLVESMMRERRIYIGGSGEYVTARNPPFLLQVF